MKCHSNEFPETLNTKPIMQALSCVFCCGKNVIAFFDSLNYICFTLKKKRAEETQLKSNQYSYPILVDGIYEFHIFFLTVILCNVIFTSSA